MRWARCLCIILALCRVFSAGGVVQFHDIRVYSLPFQRMRCSNLSGYGAWQVPVQWVLLQAPVPEFWSLAADVL
jgi:hypothetical protein